jgi:hypothetical protein
MAFVYVSLKVGSSLPIVCLHIVTAVAIVTSVENQQSFRPDAPSVVMFGLVLAGITSSVVVPH